LHPTTINALALALKHRALYANSDDHEKSLTLSAAVQPIDVAVRAGVIAADAIAQRQAASSKDRSNNNKSNNEDDGMMLTKAEEETIAGRIVGVIMRLDQLEQLLLQRVRSTLWIEKYGEWDSFGVLPNEPNESEFSNAKEEVQERIKNDPLFAMTRAECLLALFLQTVEAPALQVAGQQVPDCGRIDFLDHDRKEVLLLP